MGRGIFGRGFKRPTHRAAAAFRLRKKPLSAQGFLRDLFSRIARRLSENRLENRLTPPHRTKQAGGVALAGAAMVAASFATAGLAQAADLIVSSQLGEGRTGAAGNLAVIDAEQIPPKIVKRIEGVETSVEGAPQAVAITPDGSMAFVGAPSHIDRATRASTPDKFLQIVDLTAEKPKVARVDLGATVNALAVRPDGGLLLAAGLDGVLYEFKIADKTAKLIDKIKISEGALGGLSFAPDGQTAIVALRHEGGAAVLTVEGDKIRLDKERIATGAGPNVVDVAASGKRAVIANIGTPGHGGLTILDISRRPFRTLETIDTPTPPQGVAISPDGYWIVVQSMDGSNPKQTEPGGPSRGVVALFGVTPEGYRRISEAAAGARAQGAVFAKDNKLILLQNAADKKIELLTLRDGRLFDPHVAIDVEGAPVSIRSGPRVLETAKD